MSCLVLSRLIVRNANAQPVWWLIGPPGPTAYCGFGHALARHLKLTEHYLGIAPVHHHYELLADFNNPHQHRSATFMDHNDHVGATGKKYGALSLQPTARCNLTVSFILVFDDDAEVDLDEVNIFLATARVAGGTFFDLPKASVVETMDDVSLKGFGLHQRLDLMTEDPMDLIATCHPSKRSDHPWLMPTIYGYQAVSKRSEAYGSRDQYPHVFAEPLVGPIQYISTRQYAEIPIWNYQLPLQGSDSFLTTEINVTED